jgi:hypothetical protein
MALPPLLVKINGDSSGLDSALGKAGAGLKKLGVAAGVAAVAVVGGLAAMTAAGLRNVDTNVKLARSMDGTVNALTAVQIAAGYAGVSVGEANTSMQTLNRELASANEAGSPAAKALEKLGMSAAALSALDTDDRMAAIADRVKELGLSSSQASDILRDLGVRSRNMALLMIQGGDAIRSAREEVTAFGLELTGAQTKGIEDANDAIARMSLVFQGLSQMLAAEVAPVLMTLADRFNAIARSEATQEAIQRVVAAFGQLAEVILSEDFMGAAASGLSTIAGGAALLAEGMVFLSQNVEAVTIVTGGLAIAMAALGGPIGIVAALLGVALIALSKWRGAADDSSVGTYNAAAGTTALNAALGVFYTTAAPSAGKAAIDLAKDNHKLAASAYEAAKAEIAKAKAQVATVRSNVEGMGGMLTMEAEARLSAIEASKMRDMIQAEKALEQAIRDRKVAANAVTGSDFSTVTNPLPETITIDGLPTVVTGGGGVGSAGAVTNDMQARLKALTQGMMTEAETVQEWYEAGDETLREALDAELITRAEYDEQKLRLEAEHQEKLGKIKGQEMEVTKNVLDRVAGLMQTSNAKLFKIGQAAAIARATISGYEAAVESYKYGAAKGGPALGAALAAVSLAQTGAMISKIASQSPSGSGGGGGGGGSAGGASAATAPPQAPLEVRITGFGPKDLFNGSMITSLFDKLQDEAGDRGLRDRGLRVSFAT